MKKAYAEIKAMHPYKISQLKSMDARWQTYIKLDGKIKQVKANSEEEILDKLIDMYAFGRTRFTVESYFDKIWLPWKKENSRKKSTVKQIEQCFDKFVRPSVIAKMELSKVKSVDIENWANKVIKENNWTSHAWNSKKTAISGIFTHARKNDYIKSNPWSDVSIERHLLRTQRKKQAKEMVFYIDEAEAVIKESYLQYAKTHNCANLGIILNFELGLRVGELVALKYSDFDVKHREVYIQRQESDGEIEEYVKSDAECGYRVLQLSDSAMELVQELHKNDNGEFLICKDGERMTESKVCHRLEKTEVKLKIFDKIKGSHCIRRTVASVKDAEGVPLDEIRRWLGHDDERTTLKYIFNIYREDKSAEMHRNSSLISELSLVKNAV